MDRETVGLKAAAWGGVIGIRRSSMFAGLYGVYHGRSKVTAITLQE
jgi:hypothetical protein